KLASGGLNHHNGIWPPRYQRRDAIADKRLLVGLRLELHRLACATGARDHQYHDDPKPHRPTPIYRLLSNMVPMAATRPKCVNLRSNPGFCSPTNVTRDAGPGSQA